MFVKPGAPACSKTPLAIAEQIGIMAKEHNLELNILGQVLAPYCIFLSDQLEVTTYESCE